MLDVPASDFTIELSWQWLTQSMKLFIAPLLVGSFTAGLALASISYVSIIVLWRQNVIKRWRERKLLRSKRKP